MSVQPLRDHLKDVSNTKIALSDKACFGEHLYDQTKAIGPAGPVGPASDVVGPVGPSPAGPSGLGGSIYLYKTGGQTLAPEAEITFSNLINSGPFLFVPGESIITLLATGIYELTFSVTALQPNQFAVFLNGAPVPGSIYGMAARNSQNKGQVIFSAAIGSQVTIRNHSSVGFVTLLLPAGGIQNSIPASVVITKIA